MAMNGIGRRVMPVLVGYLGAIELVHLAVLAWAGLRLAIAPEMPFPAVAPEGGWSVTERQILIALGIADALLALVAFAFVVAWFKRTKWSRSLGTFCLSGVNSSALVYAWLVGTREAWRQDPIGYTVVVLAYVPVAILTVAWVVQSIHAKHQATGRNNDDA